MSLFRQAVGSEPAAAAPAPVAEVQAAAPAPVTIEQPAAPAANTAPAQMPASPPWAADAPAAVQPVTATQDPAVVVPAQPAPVAAQPAPVAAQPATLPASISGGAAVPAAQSTGGGMMVGSAGHVLDELEAEGFGGLDIGFLSFPTIVLNTAGEFIDNQEFKYGTKFNCFLQTSRPRYVVRATVNGKVLNNKTDLLYTYDNVVSNSGRDVEAAKRQWAAEGKMVETKKYLEVVCRLYAPNTPLDGAVRILSISPASVERFGGYILGLKMAAKEAQQRGQPATHPADVVTSCIVGPKVTRTQQPFYPWDFQRAQ